MPPALAFAPAVNVDLLAAFAARADRLGLDGANRMQAARSFLRRWPDPQMWAEEPLETRLGLSTGTHSFVMFLMLGGHVRPGYDYLIRRKLTSFWRELPESRMAGDIDRFMTAAAELGFTERTRSGTASQVIGRLLIQTGRDLNSLVDMISMICSLPANSDRQPAR